MRKMYCHFHPNWVLTIHYNQTLGKRFVFPCPKCLIDVGNLGLEEAELMGFERGRKEAILENGHHEQRKQDHNAEMQ